MLQQSPISTFECKENLNPPWLFPHPILVEFFPSWGVVLDIKIAAEAYEATLQAHRSQKNLKALRILCPGKLSTSLTHLRTLSTASSDLLASYHDLITFTDRLESRLKVFGSQMDKLRVDPEFGKTDRVKGLISEWEAVLIAEGGEAEQNDQEDYGKEGDILELEKDDVYQSLKRSLEPVELFLISQEEFHTLPTEPSEGSPEVIQASYEKLIIPSNSDLNDDPEEEMIFSPCLDPTLPLHDCLYYTMTSNSHYWTNWILSLPSHPLLLRLRSSLCWEGMTSTFSSPPSTAATSSFPISTPLSTSDDLPTTIPIEGELEPPLSRDASKARASYNTLLSEMEALKDRKALLEEKAKKDFGPFGVWEKVSDVCYEFHSGE